MRSLETVAILLLKNPRDADLVKEFEMLLQDSADISYLFDFAERYTPHSEISIPVYQRILVVQPKNIEAIVSLGLIHWLNGNDDRARHCLKTAKGIDAKHIEVLKLQAALEPDKDKKRVIFQQILQLNPQDEVAKQNLERL